jgi:hypothetical protein
MHDRKIETLIAESDCVLMTMSPWIFSMGLLLESRVSID